MDGDPTSSQGDDPMSREFAVLGNISDDYESPEKLASLTIVPPASGYPATGYLTGPHGNQQGPSVQAKDPPGISHWPRRLLHLPSWTSLEWQPGDCYGSYHRPKYSAISYTWGRFRLDSKEARKSKALRKVQGITISGCSWKTPPIDPKRFTVTEFRTALETAATLSKGTKDGKDESFLWLDVACIDQESDIGQLEVGRQAVIFQRAQTVSIWLNDFLSSELEGLFSTLQRSYKALTEVINPSRMGSAGMMQEDIDVFQGLRRALDQLCKDPWFSSLWTLQEAFLCPEARFMSRDGQVVETPGLRTLKNLTHMAERIRVMTRDLRTGFDFDRLNLPWMKRCLEIQSILEGKGLPDLASSNPMLLYSVAGKRKASKDYDYVYGIQQVFGFRLGNTAEGASQRIYSRQELQAQLGTEVLKNYPVQSQMHVFQEPVEDRHGWCISLSSRLPDSAGWEGLRHLIVQNLEPDCSLGVKVLQGQMIGHFKGRACSFPNFRKATLKGESLWGDLGTGFSIGLDAVRRVPDEPPEYRAWGRSRDMERGREQLEMAEWLERRYSRERLAVLLLGKLEKPFLGSGTFVTERSVGLLLVITEEKIMHQAYWKRIGFVVWDKDVDVADDQWEDLEGLFG